jgi:hypothetical protein
MDNGWHVVLSEEADRRTVYLAISSDGVSMEEVLHLEPEVQGGAYPVIIQASDRKMHVVYACYREDKKSHIRHVVLDPDLLIGRTAEGGPKISAQPRNTAVDLNGQATFTVAASGAGELYYQWQRNTGKGLWYNLGRSAALKTETAKDEMHGWQYRCVVTDNTGSAVSSAATLSLSHLALNARQGEAGIDRGAVYTRIIGGAQLVIESVEPAISAGLVDIHGTEKAFMGSSEKAQIFIPLRGIPDGVYILKLKTGKGTAQKVIRIVR